MQSPAEATSADDLEWSCEVELMCLRKAQPLLGIFSGQLLVSSGLGCRLRAVIGGRVFPVLVPEGLCRQGTHLVKPAGFLGLQAGDLQGLVGPLDGFSGTFLFVVVGAQGHAQRGVAGVDVKEVMFHPLLPLRFHPSGTGSSGCHLIGCGSSGNQDAVADHHRPCVWWSMMVGVSKRFSSPSSSPTSMTSPSGVMARTP